MHVIKVRNVNNALLAGLKLLQNKGIKRDSRNGPVIMTADPVTTLYRNPCERVLFLKERDANPFFHFFESLWMLAGRNDVAFIANLAKQMKEYSDNGLTLHGAYGYRWRNKFDEDQLETIVRLLKDDPNDRRCVLQMWAAELDLGCRGKDFPCNTQIYFSRDQKGRLNMTVCCRSNDIIWGAYGANAVHMSMLQEYMAVSIGCPVGWYWQVSNNYHAYMDVYEPLCEKINLGGLTPGQMLHSPYMNSGINPHPLLAEGEEMIGWDRDLQDFFVSTESGGTPNYRTKFFQRIVCPLWVAHSLYKSKKYEEAINHVLTCHATDWNLACRQWLQRRLAKYNKESDDGVTYGK